MIVAKRKNNRIKPVMPRYDEVYYRGTSELEKGDILTEEQKILETKVIQLLASNESLVQKYYTIELYGYRIRLSDGKTRWPTSDEAKHDFDLEFRSTTLEIVNSLVSRQGYRHCDARNEAKFLFRKFMKRNVRFVEVSL